MRRQSVIGGIILILLGLYFLLRQMDVPLFNQLSIWPIILIALGLFFIFSSLFDVRRDGGMFPGVILFGIGLHFLGNELFPSTWPNHWAVYTYIVSIAFFAQFLLTRHKANLVPAFVLLGVSLFSTIWSDYWRDMSWEYVWPALLILGGLIIIFRRK